MGDLPPFDPDVPSPARVYDCLLGGTDNFESDRKAADAILEANPLAGQLARENRAFVALAVEQVARQGIRQFLDLGAGLPTRGLPSVHGTAVGVRLDVVTAAVDLDPYAISQLRTIGGGLTAVKADLRDPGAVLAAVTDQAGIMLDEPLAVAMGLVVNFMGTWRARGVIGDYMGACVPGSVLVISAGHACDEGTGKRVEGAYQAGRVWDHSVEEFASMLGDLAVLPPGISDARAWLGRPWDTGRERPGTILAAVARKPG